MILRLFARWERQARKILLENSEMDRWTVCKIRYLQEKTNAMVYIASLKPKSSEISTCLIVVAVNFETVT